MLTKLKLGNMPVIQKVFIWSHILSFNETTGKMKGPEGCEGFAVLNQNIVVGLFEYCFKDQIMEIGLALKPELVGKGLGKDFVPTAVELE